MWVAPPYRATWDKRQNKLAITLSLLSDCYLVSTSALPLPLFDDRLKPQKLGAKMNLSSFKKNKNK
jgi:hypothetical protein